MNAKSAVTADARRFEILEIIFRVATGGLTVGFLIVLPSLKILGLA